MLRGLLDCHAHIADAAFDPDRADVIARARRSGIDGIVAVGETLEQARRNLDLADRHPELLPAAGLYPTVLDSEQLDALELWIRTHRDRLHAIGEVGLDRWKVQDPADRDLQTELFRRQIRLAIELELPLNVHSRSTGGPAIELLLELGARSVQMHAFGGRHATAAPAVEAGYFFSAPARVADEPQKRKLFRRLPLSCLLLETDSPVMPPERGTRNEPANARRALEGLAELKQLPVEAIAEAVVENQRRLYPRALA